MKSIYIVFEGRRQEKDAEEEVVDETEAIIDIFSSKTKALKNMKQYYADWKELKPNYFVKNDIYTRIEENFMN